jgi:glycosyltransferase involved in cell wall biosynthesis
MRKKILQLVPSLGPGGYERVVCNICRNIDPENYEITVCCLKHIGLLGIKLREDGVSIITMRPRKATIDKYFAFSKLLRIIAREKIDIVHTHSHFAFREASIARLFSNKFKLVHTFHFGDYPNLAFKKLATESVCCRIADALVTVSDDQRGRILNSFRLRPAKIRTVLNGVDTISPCHQRDRFRDEFGIPQNARVVGTIGLIHKQKNYPVFLEIARRIIKADPNVYFVIIGRGILEKEMKKLARAKGIGDNVVFAGIREDATDVIQIYDVFLLASLWEAMPMVLLEAIAAGLPIVATDVGENSKIVAHGKNGFLTAVDDIAAITKYLNRLLKDDTMREAFGHYGQKRFNKHFSSRVMVSNYERLYASC